MSSNPCAVLRMLHRAVGTSYWDQLRSAALAAAVVTYCVPFTHAQTTVLVADSLNSRVVSYNVNASNNWSVNGIFAQASDGSGLNSPGPIVYDSATSTVYIGEVNQGGAARILKYSAAGVFQGVLTTFGGEIPDSLAIAPDGNLFASNPFGTNGFEKDNIYKVNISTGGFSEFIAEPDPLFFPNPTYRLINPRGLAVAGNTLYVANRDSMGTSTGSILRFDATTGAYLDAGIGADPLTINDDVFGNFDNPMALHFNASTNTLTAGVFGGGQDLFEIDLAGSAAFAPPVSPTNTPAEGVTKIYNPSDTGSILSIDVIGGQTYWSSFNTGSVYRLDAVDTKTTVASGLGNAQGIEAIPFQGIGSAEQEWQVDDFGNWDVGANWLFGSPDSDVARALLGGVIQAPATVYMDAANTVKSLRFDNANKYAVAGAGSLTLEADTGSALITVTSGSHELQLPVELGSNTTVNVAAGTTLAFNNLLVQNGFTLTILGSGTVNFNNARVLGGNPGSIIAAPGVTLLGAAGLGALVGTAVPEPGAAALLLAGCLAGIIARRRRVW
ncbi:hypothetical protein Pla175_43470 [Pirellulimonas nuda]|uniref:PEP-CTERM protein-sorting domain-containing protein n=1 Tax=Pirellulimonas nuda TaxID=2528009 RepID=A0A518DHI4_9BACT|nr:PEP-CTERM sorting domain-containing protein [Pirellulimonas nuda]QDU90933.1 hypothetical protein Pla175_43470 [Pirellulimonas nuda]